MKAQRLLQYIICFILIFPGALAAKKEPKVLLINSDSGVEKYKMTQEEFKKAFSRPVREINLNDKKWGISEVEDLLYDENPDLIYCIGSKAYLIANKFTAEKPVVFSSVINWQRLPVTKKTYGVSNELPSGMQITLFRYVFPSVKRIGIIYSEQYNSQWFDKTREEAGKIGVTIIGQKVARNKDFLNSVKLLLPNIDALWLISDPVIISDKKIITEVFKECDQHRIPVFTYHDIFTQYGAMLIVSVDDATIGRQSAGLSNDILSGARFEERIQYPAGSHIILNLKKIKEFSLPYNQQALGIVNQVIK
jgi:putative tryptophan/tyrosine transport system substrate-binding protein